MGLCPKPRGISGKMMREVGAADPVALASARRRNRRAPGPGRSGGRGHLAPVPGLSLCDLVPALVVLVPPAVDP